MRLFQKKSCLYCRYLSKPQTVRDASDLREERVHCLKGHWKSSAVVMTLYTHPDRYREKAEECHDYERC